ncbi:hypothetical protein I350_02363 [Cryptococcus amylolentus CBS 6273]|uniref:Transmembrane protein 135 N-terminal domain-containing protein n=1 Tax=Cryptococcus amylolentus CBS 6273 TaxID=1296118 RepID=A0A1E3KAW3_9TREE|nr:hypothetical protein I350_02363 [Cryptococcus amylolentus CBS 6273]
MDGHPSSSGPSSPPAPRSKTAPPPLSSPLIIPSDDVLVSPAALLTSSPPSSSNSSSSSSQNSSPPRSSILRRTVSALPASTQIGSSSSNSSASGREKKILRFTQVRVASTVVSGKGKGKETHEEDEERFMFPGKELEEGLYMRGKKCVPRDQRDYLKTEPGTPNFSETADQIRRTLSLASLDQLAILSTSHEERTRLITEVSRAGRKLVWRDASERPLLPQDTERAALLALKRGLRSFILAFSVRSGVNVLLLLFRLLRRVHPRLTPLLLLRTIFSPDSWRFGGMLGSFTLLYTYTLHLLRLAPPWSYIKKRFRYGMWREVSFGPPEREGSEGERRWQAAVAGAVGSLALLWETKGRRTGVSQQMFVRGLQAAYNQYTPRLGIHIPHGDVLLFGACCGQIMFAFLMSPETIPKEYNNWQVIPQIGEIPSRVPQFAITANRTQVRQGFVGEDMIQQALNFKGITPENRIRLTDYLSSIRSGHQPNAAPCAMIHPWRSDCTSTNLARFFSVFRFMLPMYSALHLIPMLVLRRHSMRKNPVGMLGKALLGISRSCSFLGVFVFIYQALFCARVQTLEHGRGPTWVRSLLRRKQVFWGMGFATCLSLFVEEKARQKRRAELTMYVLPRALESAWSGARKRAWVPIVPFGETILGAVAMGMVMDAYKHQPDAISGIVRKLLFQIIGPV